MTTSKRIKRCKNCGDEMFDSSFTTEIDGRVDNYHCLDFKCKTHYYRGRWYTTEEWEDYING